MFVPILVLCAIIFMGWYGVIVDEDFSIIKWLIETKDNLLKWIKKELSKYK